MSVRVGIDFGTSNSGVAVSDGRRYESYRSMSAT
jgi:molecular chaperone DnaK (HSP70)